MSLPINLPLPLLETKWASELNPILAIPFLSGIQLKSISLINGVTVINHFLQRQMQGWFVTDIQGAAEIYRSAPLNNMTLTLTSNAAITLDLWVF